MLKFIERLGAAFATLVVVWLLGGILISFLCLILILIMALFGLTAWLPFPMMFILFYLGLGALFLLGMLKCMLILLILKKKAE